VGSSTSHNPIDLHGLLERQFHFFYWRICRDMANCSKRTSIPGSMRGRACVLRNTEGECTASSFRVTLKVKTVCSRKRSSVPIPSLPDYICLNSNSVTLSPRANYTDWATATCRRNLVPTIVDRGVTRGQRDGFPTVVNLSFLDRSRYFSFK
jgi:hypothetical protein